ncbi:MAG: hypothetical protein KAI81_07660, partial [Candidatus Marinimicrobia bacterium]|nr:hypothetical protein [Candidatus Neomarinimicrobiota bacterium]
MKMFKKYLWFFIALIMFVLTACNSTLLLKKDCSVSYEIDSLSVIQHIQYLASDELEGRYPGTAGDDKTTAFIIDHFKKYGVEAYPGQDYLQEFNVTIGLKMGADNSCKLGDTALELNKNYIPYGFSGMGEFSGSLVFAGYGINSEDANWNDYASIDVKGKCVIILESDPPIDDELMQKLDDTLQKKVLRAKDLGATAV